MKPFYRILMPFALLSSISCSDMLEYSPYDTNIDNLNFNATQISAMNDHLKSEDTLCFAVISDAHANYDNLKSRLNEINRIEGLVFIANCGDLTDTGLAQEFEWYQQIISTSKYPVISLIGNHDYRSNGHMIYEKMFGPSNSSFISGNYKFILFDDVIWENNNLSPKYEWLIDQLADTAYQNILLTHIPPWSDQMAGLNNLVFKQIVTPQNTQLSLYGHLHSNNDTIYNGVRSIVTGCLKDDGYLIVKLFNNQTFVEYHQ